MGRDILRLWCNGSSDKSFLQYCDVHPRELDYRKVKSLGQAFGSIHQLLIGWRQIQMQAFSQM